MEFIKPIEQMSKEEITERIKFLNSFNLELVKRRKRWMGNFHIEGNKIDENRKQLSQLNDALKQESEVKDGN